MDKASEILSKIKGEKIEPKSKWRFILKDYMMWAFFGAAILVGAVAFSVIIYLLNSNDWDIYEYLDKSFASYLLLSLPYLWIIVLAVFSFLAYFNYKNTRTGYRVNPIMIVLISVLLSIVIGGIAFGAGFGRFIDSTFSEKIPYYEKALMHRGLIWNNPEKGLLSGVIIEIDDPNDFFIKDFEEKKWRIKGEDILWRRLDIQEIGEKVKVIGEQESEYEFEAEEIRPWIGGGMMKGSKKYFHREIEELDEYDKN